MILYRGAQPRRHPIARHGPLDEEAVQHHIFVSPPLLMNITEIRPHHAHFYMSAIIDAVRPLSSISHYPLTDMLLPDIFVH